MSNSMYTPGRDELLGAVDWLTNNIKLVGTDHTDDTPVPATDDFLDDISAGTVFTSGNFASKTLTNGVVDAADITVTSVTGDGVDSINIYYDSGTAGTSPLLVYIDTATGLPTGTFSGGNVSIVWSGSGIFTWS